LHLRRREVLVAVVHRLELRAVDRDHRIAEQAQLAAEQDELPADALDGRTIVAPEVGDRLVVRGEPPGQPHQLDIARRLALEPPA
jgi:hypothetical protein